MYPSSAVRIRVMKRDRFQCTYCGAPGTDAELEVDHIIPRSKGGSNHMSNLTTACRSCNHSKSNGSAPKSKGVKQMTATSARYAFSLHKDGWVEYVGIVTHIGDGIVEIEAYDAVMLQGAGLIVESGSLYRCPEDRVRLFSDCDAMMNVVGPRLRAYREYLDAQWRRESDKAPDYDPSA